MIKSKKQSLIVIGAFILTLLLGSTTYAFFNYTRTGTSNVIKVGRISFESKNEETITLNNLFPIDPSNTSDMNDSTKVGTYSIDIKGDTDYVDGIEYLVSAVDTNIYTNQGQIVPITLDFTVTGLGTPNTNYFTAREDKNANIYKKIVGETLVGDQMLLVGYIKKNTTSGTKEGINGSITIKAYFDKNIIKISDTYDGTESDNMGSTNNWAEGKTVITTSEWNTLQQNGLSFKIKVEANQGIWVKGSLEEIMRTRAVMDNINSDYVDNTTPGINFGAISSDINGKGVYMRAGTENDTYPILYYRGEVEDNNVIFANKCWKAVRTTDTSGVKLLYNGEMSTNKRELVLSDYGTPVTNTGGFTFDSTDNTWNATITSSSNVEIIFNVPVAGNYQMLIKGTYGSGSVIVLKDDGVATGTIGPQDTTMVFSYDYGALTTSNKIGVRSLASVEHPCVLKVKVLYKDSTLGTGCNNMGTPTEITSFQFNTSNKSPAYVGYMYGTVYTYSNSNWTSNAKFGSSFTWDGTNYKLVDASVTTPNATHHYSCNQADAEATCTDLRYVYYVYGSTKYYITLTGGDGIEKAMTKMQTNTNDSEAKDKIDTWYASNMAEFTNKLEDTIWCNDRSVVDNNNGWIANGGDLSTNLYYGAYERSAKAESTSIVKNQPSLACANKNDRFTVNNGNGNKALDYPVALLTEDEMVLSGGVAGMGTDAYISSGRAYWSMSPNHIRINYDLGFLVNSFGDTDYYSYVDSTFGLRPVISIKPGQFIIKGTGTVADPYIIE